jgi:erythritol transport system ATP-binding protein
MSVERAMTSEHTAAVRPERSVNIVLKADAVSKVFPGTTALDSVTFNVYEGKVNVLIGENGAGKSTLMKILAGVERASQGRILLDGEPIEIHSPHDAARHGISIIYQELNLCPNLSVAENIYLAREHKRFGVFVDKGFQKQQTTSLIQRLQQNIDPDTLVTNLRIGQQQIVEIVKALSQDARILIMDEPTSALSKTEVDVLFKVIRDLQEHGVTIIYISHKLEEIMQIGDTITILRDGRKVTEAPIYEIDIPWIIEQMVGKNPAALFTRSTHRIGTEQLRVENLTLPRVGGGFAVDHVSFTLHAGEILGIYGLMGSGRTELVEALAGAYSQASGKIWLEGKLLAGNSITNRIKGGLILVPEDRQRDGLVQTLSVANNMLLASLRTYLSGLLLKKQKEKNAVTTSIRSLYIKTSNPGQLIISLSGGNQQKVVVAKALLTHPRVLMLDEPTRGIDVGAKSEIFQFMNQLASEGYGILFVSSELKEVLAMSDRILVMSKGAIVGEFTAETATEEALVTASAGIPGTLNGNNHMNRINDYGAI